MKINRNYFELRRRIDDLVYEFDSVILASGKHEYKRRDKVTFPHFYGDCVKTVWCLIEGRPIALSIYRIKSIRTHIYMMNKTITSANMG